MAEIASASVLPSNCYLQPESDDEESFVVLGSSLPPESLMVDCRSETTDCIDASVVQESINATANVLSLSKSTSSLPSIPKMKEQDMPLLSSETEVGSTTTNSSVDLSPEEVQGKLDMLIEDNIRLKETLRQNNLAMKSQYETLTLWQDDVMKVHQSHKEKFAQTKKYIENLKLENAKLINALKVAKAAEAVALKEAQALKSKIEKLEENNVEECNKELIEARNVIEIMESKLKKLQDESSGNGMSELVERLRKEIEVRNVNHLEVVARYHKELQECKSDIQRLQGDLRKQSERPDKSHLEATARFEKELQQGQALQKILLEEIKNLKSQISAPASNSSENIHEQLMAAQMHITKLEMSRSEDEETINSKIEMITKLEERIKEITDSSDASALRVQLELYKSDFEAEREAKNSIKAEKDQIVEDLRNLQRRNHQLMEEVEQLRGNDFVQIGRSPQPSAPGERPSDYQCPKCNFKFLSYQALENHVNRCLDSDF